MRKKLICFLLTSLVAINVFGQKQMLFSGSLEQVKNAGKMAVKFDFSNARIHEMTEEEFSLYETDWKKDQPQIYKDMIEELQKKVKPWLVVGPFKAAPYTMIISVHSISLQGDFLFDADIVNENNEIIASIKDQYAQGGRCGTALNLVKDGAESVGEVLGYALKRNLLYIKRKKK